MQHSTDRPLSAQDEGPQQEALLKRFNTVWLHGAGLSGSTWRSLTSRYPRAATPDLPGHGNAPRILPASVENYANTLQDELPSEAVLIGHSLGGMVALELAARPLVQPKALVLIEAVPTVRDRLSGRISALIARTLFSVIPRSWLAWLSGFCEGVKTRRELQHQLTQMKSADIAAALKAAAQYDGRRHLSQIQIPTLVIVGTKNKATHHGAKLIANGIRGAKLAKLQGGHMLHIDDAEQLTRCIEDFLRRTFPD